MIDKEEVYRIKIPLFSIKRHYFKEGFESRLVIGILTCLDKIGYCVRRESNKEVMDEVRVYHFNNSTILFSFPHLSTYGLTDKDLTCLNFQVFSKTEQNTKEDLEKLVNALEGGMILYKQERIRFKRIKEKFIW